MKQTLLSLFLFGTISCFAQDFTLDEDSGILPVQRNWDEIAFEDIDGDGFVDLYTGGVTPSFSAIGRMYKNDGTGKFTLSDEETFIKKREGGLAFGDINGDGFPDMIVSGRYGSPGGDLTRLYLNDGEGNFTLDETSSFVDASEGDIRMFDYDNDGDLDILITGSYKMHLYENDGTGIFTLNEQSGLEPYGLDLAHVIIADIDNDGFLDIVTNGRTSVSGGSHRTRIFKNNGDSTFSPISQPDLNYIAIGAIAVGDINNDGAPDIIFTGNGPSSDENPFGFSSEIFLNDGDGNFTLVENSNLIGHRDSPTIALADFNNDGYPDLITMGRINMDPTIHETYFYLNDGAGNFTLVEDTPFTGHSFGKVTVADVNNDGNLDVLITGTGPGPGNSAVAKLYLNNAETVGIASLNVPKLEIYPNPVQDVLNVKSFSGEKIMAAEVYSIDGSLIKPVETGMHTTTIDVGFLQSGVYILFVRDAKGFVHRVKFIKK